MTTPAGASSGRPATRGWTDDAPAGFPWFDADDLAAHLDIPVTDHNRATLDEACIAAQAWVTTRIRQKYANEVPPRPEIVLATKYQAAKLFRRRQTPEGIAQMGDFGPMRVMGTDPDVEALLRAFKYDGFSGGPPQTEVVWPEVAP